MCRAVNRDRPGFFDAIVNCGEGEGRARRKDKGEEWVTSARNYRNELFFF